MHLVIDGEWSGSASHYLVTLVRFKRPNSFAALMRGMAHKRVDHIGLYTLSQFSNSPVRESVTHWRIRGVIFRVLFVSVTRTRVRRIYGRVRPGAFIHRASLFRSHTGRRWACIVFIYLQQVPSAAVRQTYVIEDIFKTAISLWRYDLLSVLHHGLYRVLYRLRDCIYTGVHVCIWQTFTWPSFLRVDPNINYRQSPNNCVDIYTGNSQLL